MKRRLCLLQENPFKGDNEIAESLVVTKSRISDLSSYSNTVVDDIRTGTSLYQKFTEFRTVLVPCFNTNFMTDIQSAIEDIYRTEYTSPGKIIPMTIKAYLIGFTAVVSGGPSREHLPIAVGSIPPHNAVWSQPSKNIILYNRSTLLSLFQKDAENFAYIYTEINKDNPTLSDFDGFDKSDIKTLKTNGITNVELWAYKNGTIYTKIFEGSVDDLKIRSDTVTIITILVALGIIGIIILLLLFNNNKKRKTTV